MLGLPLGHPQVGDTVGGWTRVEVRVRVRVRVGRGPVHSRGWLAYVGHTLRSFALTLPSTLTLTLNLTLTLTLTLALSKVDAKDSSECCPQP